MPTSYAPAAGGLVLLQLQSNKEHTQNAHSHTLAVLHTPHTGVSASLLHNHNTQQSSPMYPSMLLLRTPVPDGHVGSLRPESPHAAAAAADETDLCQDKV
jgi:hypothetical protein